MGQSALNEDGLVIDAFSTLEVSSDCIKPIREIGRGEFGVVMEAVVYASGRTAYGLPDRVAVKMLHERPTRQMGQAFIREAARIKDLDHPNVVRLLAVHFRTNPLLMVMEFMPLGDLKSLLRQLKPQPFQPPVLERGHLLKLSVDVARGFQYLQDCKYVHRDIAARNVLVGGDCVAKIGDFGMARRLYNQEYYSQSASTEAGSWALPIRWMAPESYTDATWDLRTDVWMFGVLLWEVFSWAELPWGDVPEAQIVPRILQREKLPMPSEQCPEAVYLTMLSCWKLDPESRTSASEAATALSQQLQAELHGQQLEWPDLSETFRLGQHQLELHAEAADLFHRLAVPSDAIKPVEKLGEGEFGVVQLAELNIDMVKNDAIVVWLKARQRRQTVLRRSMSGMNMVRVAVKMTKPGLPEHERKQFETEALLLCAFAHPHIVKVLAVCFSAQPAFIALELMGLNLLDYVRRVNRQHIDPEDVCRCVICR